MAPEFRQTGDRAGPVDGSGDGTGRDGAERDGEGPQKADLPRLHPARRSQNTRRDMPAWQTPLPGKMASGLRRCALNMAQDQGCARLIFSG